MKAGGLAPAMIVAVVVAVVVPIVGGQAPTPSQCGAEKNNLINSCKTVAVIFWRDPSAACCALVRAAHVECVCPFVTPKLVAALGGVNRAVRLIRGCGRPVPHQFNCGSVTTP